MKTSVLVALILALPVTAMAWQPTQLTLNAPATVYYPFGGAELNIPVTVSGTPARVTFAVFTKGKADQISRVQNGFLGWHYVDAIDTCVYFSPAYDFQVGTGEVTWSGQTHDAYLQVGDSGPIDAGDYTYYLWGYDYVSNRIRATPPVATVNKQASIIVDETPDGTPLAQPFVCGMVTENPDGDGPLLWTWETHYKFLIGGDPLNTDLIETCFLGDNIGGQWDKNSWTNLAWDNDQYETCYRKLESDVNDRAAVWKMQWVPNGNAIKDETWGPDLAWNAKVFLASGMSTDGTYLYTFTGDLFEKTEMSVRAYIIDKASGEMLFDFYHEDRTDFDQYAGGTGADYLNGGALEYHQVRNGLLYGGNFVCLMQALDPIRYMETEDYTDYKRWTNKNGDWISDKGWQETATYKWACFGEDEPSMRALDPDHLSWVLNMVGHFGAVSFSLFAPDGTGVGYFGIQGDAERGGGTNQVCDAGSAYDGMYVDNLVGSGAERYGFFYIGFDNFMGTITNVTGVADAAPAAFAVAQNTPNPFNPTTTINFTIPQAGRVNVDVYNVAGQKVDTLVNDSMEAGNHTVTFDGANLAAGVYFYTVKAGEFSKTMKMTLLK